MDLLCALVQLNNRDTLEMLDKSKLVTTAHQVNCQRHVADHTNKLVTNVRLPSNTCGAPNMHHTKKLVMSAHYTIKYTWRTRHVPHK